MFKAVLSPYRAATFAKRCGWRLAGVAAYDVPAEVEPIEGCDAVWGSLRVALWSAPGLAQDWYLRVTSNGTPFWAQGWRYSAEAREVARYEWRWAVSAALLSWGDVPAAIVLRDADGRPELELGVVQLAPADPVEPWRFAVVVRSDTPDAANAVHECISYDEAMEEWCATAEQWAIEELDPQVEWLVDPDPTVGRFQPPVAARPAAVLAARLRMQVAQARVQWMAGVCGSVLRHTRDRGLLDAWGSTADVAAMLDVSRPQVSKVIAGQVWRRPNYS
jgi:hypothetical protein